MRIFRKLSGKRMGSMVITQTPLRMSFAGGGTDFPQFFQKHGGSVIAATFDKYCYVTARRLPPFFAYKSEICYAETERVRAVSEIRHPAVRNALLYLGMENIRLTYECDLPARSGLGTSSAFAVGMLSALHTLQGKTADKRKLADEAIYLERELCGECGGWQDQISTAFGGFHRIDFSADGYTVKPLVISPARKSALADNLLLFFTGVTRHSAEVQREVAHTLGNKTAELCATLRLVDEAERILTGTESLDSFGRLLDELWQRKKALSPVISAERIDGLYERAKNLGALGGKLLGAGGGGFLLFYVPQERRQAVLCELSELVHVPFRLESGGTRILYYRAEDE